MLLRNIVLVIFVCHFHGKYLRLSNSVLSYIIIELAVINCSSINLILINKLERYRLTVLQFSLLHCPTVLEVEIVFCVLTLSHSSGVLSGKIGSTEAQSRAKIWGGNIKANGNNQLLK